jgi:hypothetical protein
MVSLILNKYVEVLTLERPGPGIDNFYQLHIAFGSMKLLLLSENVHSKSTNIVWEKTRFIRIFLDGNFVCSPPSVNKLK